MKTLRFKITILLLFIGLITTSAQKLEKKHTEKFTVNKDVVIDVNTRYTDIEIETWNKNEVVIEAYIDISNETDQKVIDDYLKNWNFEAIGNKSSIKIGSKSSGLIDIHTFDFDAPNYDRFYSESVTDALENLRFVMPEIPELPELPEILIELPEMPELPELPPMPTKFDFEAYKKDKSYLEKWKKENKEVIGKNSRVKVGRNSLSIDDDNTTFRWSITSDGQDQIVEELKESLEKSRTARNRAYKQRQEALKKRHKEMKKRQEKLKEHYLERDEKRKLALIKRQEAHEIRAKEMAKHRTEVRDILEKRKKINIKRIIKIKAPKNAKFNMNVKYGSMSFPN